MVATVNKDVTKDILAVKIWAQRSLPPPGVACLHRQRNWGDMRVNLQIWGEDKAEWISPGRNQHSSPQLVTVSHWVYNNVQCVDDKAVKCRHWTIVKRGKYIGRKGSAGWSMSKSIEWVMAPVTASLLLCCALLSASLLAVPYSSPMMASAKQPHSVKHFWLLLAVFSRGGVEHQTPKWVERSFWRRRQPASPFGLLSIGSRLAIAFGMRTTARNWMGIGWHAGVHIFRLSDQFRGSSWVEWVAVLD